MKTPGPLEQAMITRGRRLILEKFGVDYSLPDYFRGPVPKKPRPRELTLIRGPAIRTPNEDSDT